MQEHALYIANDQKPGIRPRVGFLGLGWIGANRMEAAVGAGNICAAAIADVSGEALQKANAVVPGASVCGSLDELLREDLDALVVATPSAMHAEQSMHALEKGLAVFCQKPLGRSWQETRAVVDAARRADRLLGVDFSYRHLQGVRVMRDLIRDGAIGEVFSVRAVFHNAYGPGKAWFFDAEKSGGGCVIDLGIHLVDLVLWTLDAPEVERVSSRLFGEGRRLTGRDGTVEDYAVARLDLSNGAIAELACSWNLSTGCDAVIELTFHGSRGSLSLKNVDGSYYDFVALRHSGRSTETIAEPPDDWGGRAIAAWATRLSRDRRFDPSVEDAIHVSAVLDAIYSHESI